MNFDRYLHERTRDYSPRPWLLDRIAAWLSAPGSRYLLVTAEPGGGKTAVAAQVVLASRGLTTGQTVPVPLGAIAAHHFCSSKDAGWIEPLAFSRSISTQLAAAIPGFEQALIDSRPVDRPITAAPQLQIGHVESGGQVTGVQVTLHTASPSSAFNWEVRAPLEKLYDSGFDRDVIILVDALDEARLAGQGESVFDLIAQVSQWPPRVRFLVTSRPEQPIIRTLQQTDPGLVEIALGHGDERERSRQDVRRYIVDRTPRIGSKLAPDFPAVALEEELSKKADGNFLWVVFAMSMLASAPGTITAGTLAGLPQHLSPLYLEFIERLARSDRDRWFSRHTKVLGTLVVAQEAMTEAELSAYSGVELIETTRIVVELTQLLDSFGDDGRPRWSIYHRSFVDFLLDRNQAREYACDELASHRRFVDMWLTAVAKSGVTDLASSDHYARRNIAAHLFALRSDEVARGHLQALVSREWMEVKADDPAFARDVALAAQAAVDLHPLELVQQIRATSVLTALHSRAQAAPPELLAAMARLGNVEQALSYLTLSNVPETKARTSIEVAEALLATDPSTAERLLSATVTVDPEQTTRVGALRARAFASMGRFDDVLPLIPALGERREAEGVIALAVTAGRVDVAEAIVRNAREEYRRSALIAKLVDVALACGEREVAARVVVAAPVENPEARLRVARALRIDDPGRSVRLVATADQWQRSVGCATLAADAAVESDKSLDLVIAHLPESELPSILERSATILAEAGHVDAAIRLAERVSGSAVTNVRAVHLRTLAKAGEVTRALELASAPDALDPYSWFELTKEVAVKGSVEQVVSSLSHVSSSRSQLDEVLAVAAQERERPAFVLGVLEGLGDAATVRTRARVAAALVRHRSIEGAFAVADAAPSAMRDEIVQSIAEAALDLGLLDEALVAYRRAPRDPSPVTDRLIAGLIDADRLDDALAISADARGRVDARVLRMLADRLTTARRIPDAIDVARGSDAAERVLARVLLNDPSEATLQAIRQERASTEEIVDRVARTLELRGSPDDAESLRTLHRPWRRVDDGPLSRSALAAAYRPDRDVAYEAVRRALDTLAAEPHTWSPRQVLAMVAAAAVHVLPYDDAVEAIEKLSPNLAFEDFIELAALNGDAKAAMAIAGLGIEGFFRTRAPVARAIDSLVETHRWDAAFQVVLFGGDEVRQKEILGDLLDAAASDGQLEAAVASGRAINAPFLDEILWGLVGRPTRLSVRAQALALLEGHHHDRRTLVEDLIDRRQFGCAAKVARHDSDLLAKVMTASVVAGTPLDIKALAMPGEELEPVLSATARELLAAGKYQEAADYARRLGRPWHQREIAVGLADSGHLDLALDVARGQTVRDQDQTRVAVAAAVAPKDYDAATRVLRSITDNATRVDGVTAVIRSLLHASQVERALTMKAASTLLPTSVNALATVAVALLDAGQTREAGAAADAALQLVNSIEDGWSRDAALADLARSMVRRGQLDQARAINDLIPRTRRSHVWVTMDIARQRARDGDAATAIGEVNAAIAVVRQSDGPDTVRNEAQLTALLVALRGLGSIPAVFEEIVAAARPNPSLVPFVVADLTRHLHSSEVAASGRPFDGARRRLWRWRTARSARWLLARASTIVVAEADERMRLQAWAAIAVRYSDVGRHREALEAGRKAEDAVRWPAAAARIFAVSAVGYSQQKAGHTVPASELLRNAIDAVVAMEDGNGYDMLRDASTLLAALDAPTAVVDRLLAEVVRPGHYRQWQFTSLLEYAAEGDAGRAGRIGRAVVGVTAKAPIEALPSLAGLLVHCGTMADDRTLVDEAWTLVQKLDVRNASIVLPRAAVRLAESGSAAARIWADAAMRAITTHPDPASIPTLRTQVAGAIWRLGAREEARQHLATALDEVRTVSREAFFAVLHGWITALDDHDERLPAIAETIVETERWWKHRST